MPIEPAGDQKGAHAVEGPNQSFYSGRRKTRHGIGIEELLTWRGRYEQLERDHAYIQWLFPNHFQSNFNSSAYPLTNEEAYAFREDMKMACRLVRGYEMFLDFLGMRLANRATGQVTRAQDFDQRYRSALITNTHNHLRIQRMCACLAVTGLYRYVQGFLSFLHFELYGRPLPLRSLAKGEVLTEFLTVVPRGMQASSCVYGNKMLQREFVEKWGKYVSTDKSVLMQYTRAECLEVLTIPSVYLAAQQPEAMLAEVSKLLGPPLKKPRVAGDAAPMASLSTSTPSTASASSSRPSSAPTPVGDTRDSVLAASVTPSDRTVTAAPRRATACSATQPAAGARQRGSSLVTHPDRTGMRNACSSGPTAGRTQTPRANSSSPVASNRRGAVNGSSLPLCQDSQRGRSPDKRDRFESRIAALGGHRRSGSLMRAVRRTPNTLSDELPTEVGGRQEPSASAPVTPKASVAQAARFLNLASDAANSQLEAAGRRPSTNPFSPRFKPQPRPTHELGSSDAQRPAGRPTGGERLRLDHVTIEVPEGSGGDAGWFQVGRQGRRRGRNMCQWLTALCMGPREKSDSETEIEISVDAQPLLQGHRSSGSHATVMPERVTRGDIVGPSHQSFAAASGPVRAMRLPMPQAAGLTVAMPPTTGVMAPAAAAPPPQQGGTYFRVLPLYGPAHQVPSLLQVTDTNFPTLSAAHPRTVQTFSPGPQRLVTVASTHATHTFPAAGHAPSHTAGVQVRLPVKKGYSPANGGRASQYSLPPAGLATSGASSGRHNSSNNIKGLFGGNVNPPWR